MKIATVIACAFLGFVASQQSRSNLYTSEFDTIDVQEILNNRRLLDNYIACLKNTKPCTKSGSKLKEFLPDAIRTGCKRCTATQKKKGREVFDFLIEKRPEVFLDLEKMYDPERIYRKKHAERIKAAGLKLPE